MLKKRSAEDDAVHESSAEDEDIDASLMEALKEAEQRTLHMTSTEYCMPLVTCEESGDTSYLDSEYARGLSDAIDCTKVGEVRHTLDRRLSQCMMAELCGEEFSTGLLSSGGSSEAELGASIFDHGSPMGVNLQIVGTETCQRPRGRDPLLSLEGSSTTQVRVKVDQTCPC